MKKILSILSLVAVTVILVTACNQKPVAETKGISYADTVGLAQFQEWKAQNERVNPAMAYQPAQAASAAPRKTTSRTVSRPAQTASTQPAVATTQKKGWSKAAKGTAIGAGSGAVLGAVINKKNRVLGGVIGGVIGGGIGYGIGRSMDKKDGRVSK